MSDDGLAKSRRSRVSLPKITALLDDPRYVASADPAGTVAEQAAMRVWQALQDVGVIPADKPMPQAGTGTEIQRRAVLCRGRTLPRRAT